VKESKERNKVIPAVYAILKKDDSVLLTRRLNTGWEDGNYSLPSGHVEKGESPLSAIIRETKEEVGVTFEAKDTKFVQFMSRPGKDTINDRVDLFYEVSSWQGELTNCEPDKCDDIQWFPLNQLPLNIIPDIKFALENISKGNMYSELDTNNNFVAPLN
jgi:8-oxo-dGTP diphosphatase